MDNEERLAKQKRLIEEIGWFYDKEGLQPIAGRIMGLLMVMDQERFTFDEIVEHLNISKSSASTALRNLEILGSIEYVTLPGDRKRYFQIKRKNALNLVDDFERKMLHAKDFFSQVVELKADKNSQNALFLTDMLGLIDFLLEKIRTCRSES
ncbi:GbsR/MarR family transcriptional regulator [Sunxiuqinia sp. A32]|uniref:GbsR/MarR family transcriptional regulator n=1 Tax=Sunxiuqinia sp. A32 TaxID=3461496 RepID=UPI00404565AB